MLILLGAEPARSTLEKIRAAISVGRSSGGDGGLELRHAGVSS